MVLILEIAVLCVIGFALIRNRKRWSVRRSAVTRQVNWLFITMGIMAFAGASMLLTILVWRIAHHDF
jgi:hypothetical protein